MCSVFPGAPLMYSRVLLLSFSSHSIIVFFPPPPYKCTLLIEPASLISEHTCTHRDLHKPARLNTYGCRTQARRTQGARAHKAHTVPVHLTKPLSSWKRLIWAPAAPNHPIRDRAISSLLSLSEPFVQVLLFLRWWQDEVVFRASCHSFWAHSEGLSLAGTLQ